MHSKQHKTTKVIKLQWLASIWCQNIENNPKLKKWSYYDEFASIWCQIDQKCWVTSQNIQNNAKVQKRSNYDELHRFHLKSIKTTQITKAIKLQWIASIWRHNDQKCCVTSQNIRKNAKLQKWSKYDDLHRFDVKTIKTTQNYKSNQITMNCIDLTS